MSILGIHHLTAVCSNAQQTVDFYTRILGMRLVKKTVNFDDPGAYHLYFGNRTGSPGTLITFFEWAHLPRGHWGIGTTHHLALIVETAEAQLKWKRWLIDHGVWVTGPYDRRYFNSIYFTDPDGLILEIATRGPGWTVDEPAESLGEAVLQPPFELTRFGRKEEEIARRTASAPVESITPDMEIAGMHHISAMSSDIDATTDFYTNTLGMRLLKKTSNYDDPTTPHYYYGVGEGAPGTIVTYFGYGPGTMRQGTIGTGMTHHFAFAVENAQVQLEWRSRLMKASIPVSPVMERVYFKSIYFNDPDGHILEIATLAPGMGVDEDLEHLGEALRLPQWLEPEREEIEHALAPLGNNF